MNLSHRILSSTLLAGAVLSATLLPLVTLGSKPIIIQLEEKPVFVGPLRELAAPYVALATGLSLGVGAVSLSLLSWQQAARKIARREAEVAALQQQLTEKAAFVEQLRFSSAKLQSSGLEQFLQPPNTAATESSLSVRAAAPEVMPSPLTDRPHSDRPSVSSDRTLMAPVIDDRFQPTSPATAAHFSTAGLEFFLDAPPVSEPAPPISSTVSTPQPSLPSVSSPPPPLFTSITEPVKLQALTALPAAQVFNSFARSDRAANSRGQMQSPRHLGEATTQLNELLSHLKQVMTQIEQLQTAQSPASNSNHS